MPHPKVEKLSLCESGAGFMSVLGDPNSLVAWIAKTPLPFAGHCREPKPPVFEAAAKMSLFFATILVISFCSSGLGNDPRLNDRLMMSAFSLAHSNA